MLVTVLMVVDFIVCVALIGAVLMQTGRGAGLSSSFGGGDGTFFVQSVELNAVEQWGADILDAIIRHIDVEELPCDHLEELA